MDTVQFPPTSFMTFLRAHSKFLSPCIAAASLASFPYVTHTSTLYFGRYHDHETYAGIFLMFLHCVLGGVFIAQSYMLVKANRAGASDREGTPSWQMHCINFFVCLPNLHWMSTRLYTFFYDTKCIYQAT